MERGGGLRFYFSLFVSLFCYYSASRELMANSCLDGNVKYVLGKTFARGRAAAITLSIHHLGRNVVVVLSLFLALSIFKLEGALVLFSSVAAAHHLTRARSSSSDVCGFHVDDN